MNKTILLIWLLSLVLAIGWPLVNYHSLPDRMASHFDFSGKPNGYSSKDALYRTWFLLVFLLNILVIGVPALMRVLPAKLINVPNREYWLATPERKRACVGRMAGMVAITYSIINLFLIGMFQSIVDINQGRQVSFPLWLPFILLPLAGVLAVVFILVAFKVPPADQSTRR